MSNKNMKNKNCLSAKCHNLVKCLDCGKYICSTGYIESDYMLSEEEILAITFEDDCCGNYISRTNFFNCFGDKLGKLDIFTGKSGVDITFLKKSVIEQNNILTGGKNHANSYSVFSMNLLWKLIYYSLFIIEKEGYRKKEFDLWLNDGDEL